MTTKMAKKLQLKNDQMRTAGTVAQLSMEFQISVKSGIRIPNCGQPKTCNV